MRQTDAGVTSTVGRSTVTGSVGALLPNDGMIGKSFSMRLAAYKQPATDTTAMVAGMGATEPTITAPVTATPPAIDCAAIVKLSGVMIDVPAPTVTVGTIDET